MKKTDCPECMALFDHLFTIENEAGEDEAVDIPTTRQRTLAVWARQDCTGAHSLDEWVAAEQPTEAG